MIIELFWTSTKIVHINYNINRSYMYVDSDVTLGQYVFDT